MGGIYTVIKTKAPVTVQEYGDRYCMIGPLNHRSAPVEVESLEPPTEELREAIKFMESQGFRITFGRWLIEGAPYVLLFDLASASHRLNQWKGELWNIAGIPSPPNDTETNDAVVFGYLVALFLQQVSSILFLDLIVLDSRTTEEKCGHRPFSRMAGWSRFGSVSQMGVGSSHYLYDARHSPRKIPLCWRC